MSKIINSRLIGQTIKALRLSRHWTQDYLADIVGYSVRNLRRIENDGTGSIDVVNTFADIFEVSAIDILSGDVFCFIWDITKKSVFHRIFAINSVFAGFFVVFLFYIGDLRHTRLTLICYSRTFTPG